MNFLSIFSFLLPYCKRKIFFFAEETDQIICILNGKKNQVIMLSLQFCHITEQREKCLVKVRLIVVRMYSIVQLQNAVLNDSLQGESVCKRRFCQSKLSDEKNGDVLLSGLVCTSILNHCQQILLLSKPQTVVYED